MSDRRDYSHSMRVCDCLQVHSDESCSIKADGKVALLLQ